MNIIFLAVATRILFILGIFNILTGLLVFLSCRCLHGSKIGNALSKNPGYQRFYKLHCHIWKVFWPSVMVHAVLAAILFGWPG